MVTILTGQKCWVLLLHSSTLSVAVGNMMFPPSMLFTACLMIRKSPAPRKRLDGAGHYLNVCR